MADVTAIAVAPPAYRISVRALCEFTAKHGDLDLRFTPAPTAQEGMQGHRTVVSRRGANYQAEVRLDGTHGDLQLRGRADGYDVKANRLEEIKTYRGDVEAIPANHRALHWAQLKIYGALLCRARDLERIALTLVYFNVDSQRETPFTEHCDAAALDEFLIAHSERFLDWARQESTHRQHRDTALRALQFPFPTFRRGQRDLAEAVYKSICMQRHLLVQAPTGIGKTLATVFPLLKAFATRAIDKGFFLTAKTTGRALALDAVAKIRLAAPDLPLRTLELTARDKACEYPGQACHGEACPLARGFYDRLPTARQAAVKATTWSQASVREIALAHQVCPYYFAMELVRWSDLVVGDYNYFFDVSALLYNLTAEQEWRVGILVDEAHNLIERARGMYSAALTTDAVAAARAVAPTTLKRSLGRVHAQWRDLVAAQADDYAAHAEIPAAWLLALRNAVAKIADYNLKHPIDMSPTLQQFYFDALHFCNLAETFGEHSLCDQEKTHASPQRAPRSRITLRNIVPAPFLTERFAAAAASTLFSATLFPSAYHRDLLGLPPATVSIDVPSPFACEQLAVHIEAQISTRFAQRETSIEPIARLIAAQYHAAPGNYIAYFSSFEYLDRVAQAVQHFAPLVPLRRQTSRMSEDERRAFLDAFTDASRTLGFAVLGGAFGEGIDLPGKRLIGAFVATLGLPQFNAVNEQMKQRLGKLFGARNGYDYTYLFPGLQKVVQAAGRVVRSTEDKGVLYLIDDRFAHRATQRLLPAWWELGRSKLAQDENTSPEPGR